MSKAKVFYNFQELMELNELPFGWERGGEMRVGEWKYDQDALTVVHDHTTYSVDLEECQTSAAVLDWLCQVANKTWATNDTIGDLLTILQAILHPQGCLCSYGVEHGPKSFTGKPRAPRLAEKWYHDPRNPNRVD